MGKNALGNRPIVPVDHPVNLPGSGHAVHNDSVRPEVYLRDRSRRVALNYYPGPPQKRYGISRTEAIFPGQRDCRKVPLFRYDPLFSPCNQGHDRVFTGPKRGPDADASPRKDGKTYRPSGRAFQSEFNTDLPAVILPYPFIGNTATTGPLTTGAFATGTSHNGKIACNSGVLK
jgi:hypothetical protein